MICGKPCGAGPKLIAFKVHGEEIAKTLQDPKYLPTQAIPVAEFVSKRVGCYVYQPAYGGISLASVCLKSS